MKENRKIVWQQHGIPSQRSFLPPVAVLVVCAVFIGLILIMGLMNRQSIDQTLVRFMEERALGTVGVLERLAQENINNLNRLVQAHRSQGESRFAPLTEGALAAQRSFMAALVEIAREVDRRWKEGSLSDEFLEKYAAGKGIWLIAALDRGGKSIYASRSLPADLFPGANRIWPITLDTLNQLSELKKISFIALRRPDGSGTTIIALNPEMNRSFGTKVSIEKALSELGGGKGLVYIMIMDRRGMPLGSSGRLPQSWREGDVNLPEILAGTKAVESRKVLFEGKKLFDVAAPVTLNGQIAGYARLGMERDATDQILSENERQIFVFMALVVGITLLAMWLLYVIQNRHMAGVVEMERQLEKAERLSALGQLAAGVAHEIRNPLNAISMASQRLKREFMPADEAKQEEFKLFTGVIRDEIRRLNGIIEEFLTFSKSRRLELHDYPVAEVLQKILNLIQAEADARGIAVEGRWGTPSAIIPMDVDKLQQALLNFIKNAMESMPGEGTLTVSVDFYGRDRIRIRIADTGCGMTTEQVGQIFNPEYTTKEKGLGLGLPLAHEIIRGHGGEIRVFSEEGVGTTFEILLPTERVNGSVKGKEG